MSDLQSELAKLVNTIKADPALAEAAYRQLVGENGNKNNEGENHPNQEGATTMPTPEQIKTQKQINELAEKAGLALPFHQNDVAGNTEKLMDTLEALAVEKGLGKEFRAFVSEHTGPAAKLFGSTSRAKRIAGNVIEYAAIATITVGAAAALFWVLKKMFGADVTMVPMDGSHVTLSA